MGVGRCQAVELQVFRKTADPGIGLKQRLRAIEANLQGHDASSPTLLQGQSMGMMQNLEYVEQLVRIRTQGSKPEETKTSEEAKLDEESTLVAEAPATEETKPVEESRPVTEPVEESTLADEVNASNGANPFGGVVAQPATIRCHEAISSQHGLLRRCQAVELQVFGKPVDRSVGLKQRLYDIEA